MSYNKKLYPSPSLMIQEATNATEKGRYSQLSFLHSVAHLEKPLNRVKADSHQYEAARETSSIPVFLDPHESYYTQKTWVTPDSLLPTEDRTGWNFAEIII